MNKKIIALNMLMLLIFCICSCGNVQKNQCDIAAANSTKLFSIQTISDSSEKNNSDIDKTATRSISNITDAQDFSEWIYYLNSIIKLPISL